MDIMINHPIKIFMETIEIDDHLPSLKFNIKFFIDKYGFNASLEGNFWIECIVFDSFIKNLQSSKLAILHDLDQNMKLEINTAQQKMYWFCVKDDLNGNLVRFESTEQISLDEQKEVLNQFQAYPQWW
ncbi:hypothetical protein PT286_03540 [Neisseriaceae bacterium ESL0693]|nr:hypothetical protein [Neisseriaceae bacterium ESL0693]